MINKSILHYHAKETLSAQTKSYVKPALCMAIKLNRWHLKFIQARRRKKMAKFRQTQWQNLAYYLNQHNKAV